jgi:hypothetical protein
MSSCGGNSTAACSSESSSFFDTTRTIAIAVAGGVFVLLLITTLVCVLRRRNRKTGPAAPKPVDRPAERVGAGKGRRTTPQPVVQESGPLVITRLSSLRSEDNTGYLNVMPDYEPGRAISVIPPPSSRDVQPCRVATEELSQFDMEAIAAVFEVRHCPHVA